jgi:hypothetical protein
MPLRTPACFALYGWNGVPHYKSATAPNIASLMLMVEEQGQRILLTGDSQQDIILKGLQTTGFLDTGAVHLAVLKVQHHGSDENLHAQFCRKVSADHSRCEPLNFAAVPRRPLAASNRAPGEAFARANPVA